MSSKAFILKSSDTPGQDRQAAPLVTQGRIALSKVFEQVTETLLPISLPDNRTGAPLAEGKTGKKSPEGSELSNMSKTFKRFQSCCTPAPRRHDDDFEIASKIYNPFSSRRTPCDYRGL